MNDAALNIAAVVLLGVVAVAGLGLTARGERLSSSRSGLLLPAGLALVLAVAAALAWAAGGASDRLTQTGALVAVLAAVAAGGPVATGVLRAADPAAVGVIGGPQDSDILRGGAWIGALERAAVGATLLAGSAEGLVVVLAVKGLGRYAELRSPAAAERFIVGTLASALWAAACVGVAVLLRR
jgi:hypothetical protein